MKKKVLIIGNSSKEYALAKKLAETCEVFVAPGNDAIKEFANCIDIRETSSQELSEFVLENGIDMTIPLSEAALKTDIVNLFNKNNLQIFAPSKEASSIIYDKANAKKILYKLRISTPKFGIFEKQSMASDYLKNIGIPFVIKTNQTSSAVILTSVGSSKPILDSIFTEKGQKVIIEDYIYGTPFAFYAITDGYKALPIGSSMLYKYSLEGEGGQLTSGMGACIPNYKLSFKHEDYLMNYVIYPTLDYMEANGSTYTGILGINGILTEEGMVKVLGYQNFMNDSDAPGIINLINDDLYRLFESCILGSFSDEVDCIQQKDLSAVSIVLNCINSENKENVINGLELLNDDIDLSFTNNVNKNRYLEFEANSGPVMTLTAFGHTMSLASLRAYSEIKSISYKGMKYRNDICKIREFDGCLSVF